MCILATTRPNLHTKCQCIYSTRGELIWPTLHPRRQFFLLGPQKCKEFLSPKINRLHYEKCTVSMATVKVILDDESVHTKLIVTRDRALLSTDNAEMVQSDAIIFLLSCAFFFFFFFFFFASET